MGPSREWLLMAAEAEGKCPSVSVGGLAAELGLFQPSGVVLVGGPFEGMAVQPDPGARLIVVKGEPDGFGMRQVAAYWRDGARAMFRDSWASNES